MIIEVNQDRLEEVCLYTFNLNKMKKNQCRPFKSDIVLSEVQDKFSRLVFHNDDKLLISIDDNQNINGVLGLFTELDDDYLQAFCGIYAHLNYAEVGTEFIEYLEKEYKGLKMLFAFPKENTQGIELMNKHRFNKIEDAVIYELTDKLDYLDSNKNVVSNEYIEEKQVVKFYEENQEEVYWTIDKLLMDFPNWIIKHYVKDEVIIGSIFCRIYNSYSAEIFGILSLDVSSRDKIEMALVKQASLECQSKGIGNVTFFSDLTRYNLIADEIGFIEVDTHLTFERLL